MQISVSGIQAAATGYATAYAALAVLFTIITIVSIRIFFEIHDTLTDEAKREAKLFDLAGLFIMVYLVAVVPATLWFIWNAVLALMAPEFYILQKLN